MNHVDGLWFSNDTLVVLRAGDSLFRVPRSILAARSPVFRAMFEFPQPAPCGDGMADSDGDEMMDGSPVIRLHDSPTQVEPFLRAIFDSSFFMPPPAAINFHAVLGILRLAHKYDVHYLYKRAISHLETIYSLTLDEFVIGHSSDPLGYIDAESDADLMAIPVLHEVGATWLLPSAYCMAADMLSAGVTWDAMSPDMTLNSIQMSGFLARGTQRVYDALTNLSTCASRDACDVLKFRFLKVAKVREDRHCFGSLILHVWGDDLEGNLCDDCAVQARVRYDEVRAEIWDELPLHCGLEKWEILMKTREAALAE